MLDREYIEAKPEWQATFRYTHGTRPGQTHNCLLRAHRGGYFWETPDYDGLFTWGGTQTFCARSLADSLTRGYMVLEAGELPAEVTTALETLALSSAKL